VRRRVRPSGLLVEFRNIEIEVVEKDVAHVGQIDALAECRRRDDHPDRAGAEELLDLQPLGRPTPA